MPKLSPSEYAAKWAANFGASADKYKRGIQSVSVNPAQQAIAAKDRMLQGFTDAVTSGRWEANLGKVTLASWQQAAMDKGANAIPAAARVGQAKAMAAEQVNAPLRDSVLGTLPARGTIDQNLERARLFALGMHNGRKGRG